MRAILSSVTTKWWHSCIYIFIHIAVLVHAIGIYSSLLRIFGGLIFYLLYESRCDDAYDNRLRK